MATIHCQLQGSMRTPLPARSLKTPRAIHGPSAGVLRTSTLLRPASITLPRRLQDGQTSSGRLVKCNGLFGLGLPEIAVIAGITALVFGPSKLPELGKGLGKTIKSFQTAAKEFETELKTAAASEEDEKKPAAAQDDKIAKKSE